MIMYREHEKEARKLDPRGNKVLAKHLRKDEKLFMEGEDFLAVEGAVTL
jgi:hypothetical protein